MPSSSAKKFKSNSDSKNRGRTLKKHVNSKDSWVDEISLQGGNDDFPRGGGSLMYGKGNDRALELDEHEMVHRAHKKRKKDNRTRGINASADNDLGSLFGDGVRGKMPRFANRITLKNVSTGMKLWGMIAEVNEKDIVISLPGGLRGLVRACDAVDPLIADALKGDVGSNFLFKLYKEQQLVPCIVLQVDDDRKDATNRKIWLSLRLSLLYKFLTLDAVQEGMVLNAYIQSVEDHGCVLYFGFSSFTGFMPKRKFADGREIELNTGQILQGVVTSVDRARKVVHLNSDPEVISNSVAKEPNSISIDILSPGMMVNARVISTLENGVMLSFLSYFTGTVDIFNLTNTIPSSSWKNDYTKNMKVNSRILFIDPATRAVGLTLNPYLAGNKAPPSPVKIGDIFDQSKVVRVDKAFGVLVELPTEPSRTPALVSVADAFDEAVENLDFKEGNVVRIRILGYRHLEGLAIGSLKASALKGLVFTHSDLTPGMVVKAKIVKVRSSGAIVQFASGVKALCPLRHMSEFEIAKPPKKFQVGVELVFRVLGCRSKRISVTHKKTLVKSKLKILSSYADASDGLVTHGWITKIERHGCFVRFYNGVEGFAARSELNLGPADDIDSLYHVEQVVKCRVVKYHSSSRRLNLSFNVTQSRSSMIESIKPGTIVSGVCDRVTSRAVIVSVNGSSNMRGKITLEHLADHRGLAALFMAALKPGYLFDQLLVLDVEGNDLVLSAKCSLLTSAQQLPVDVNEIRCPSVMHGYICNIIESGCFIRFLGRLTGFAPRSKATDDYRSDLSEIFYVGQSVRCIALDVSTEMTRITLTLKQSLCCSNDASYTREYFSMEEKIAKMQALDTEIPGSWSEGFGICSIVEGKVREIKDVGAVISFDKYNDVYGFISHYQLSKILLEVNSIVRAAVLDVSKIDRVVDLSLKPEFLNTFAEEVSTGLAFSKKRKTKANMDLEVNQAVKAIVEIVKENYLVLSLPNHESTIGYALRTDYNTQNLPNKQFVHGQCVHATVLSLPAPSTCGRLLLMLTSIGDGIETCRTKRAKRNHCYDVGSIVQVEITEIKPFEVRVKFASGHRGRIHITETTDGNSAETPFSAYIIGQTLTAIIVSKANKQKNGRGSYLWELSVKPSLLDGFVGVDEFTKSSEDIDYIYGQCISGFVYNVDSEWAWLTISRGTSAKLYFLDSSCEPSELAEFQNRFSVGKRVYGYIISVNKEKKLLRLVLNTPANSSSEHENFSQHHSVGHLVEGSFIGGKISKILPGVGGLLVQVGSHHYGMVHFTELTDSWELNPLSGYQEGQFVKCKVLELNHSAKGTVHVDLSLRSASAPSDYMKATEHSSDLNFKRPIEITDLQPDMAVKGYVKNISDKGCFIMLSRKLDAKILISNLSDNYVENPELDFPIGKLVAGKVRSVEPLSKRVEVTLKTSDVILDGSSDVNSFDRISVGTIISGRIKRVQSFGLFIAIDGTNVVGLCHISEVSNGREEHLEANYAAGERVSAKVLKKDKDRRRVSLGMKNSYMKSDENLQVLPQQNDDLAHHVNDSCVPAEPMVFACIESMNGTPGYDLSPITAEAESRALVPPLEVPLDDIANLDCEVISDQRIQVTNVESIGETDRRRVKKRARLERETEIRAAEERLLEEDTPKNADEFEKLVRNSPNSSFIWIKYMAYMLSLADVEKARSIAERALQTINIREESEKLNIWVAYFNLENEYGNPREEAVNKVFQRALQSCDSKKVHLALLGMYDRTEQHELCDGLLNKMTRKFKRSSKVWLRRINFLLKNNADAIQSTVNHALLSLPRHKHVKFISQSAILEFKCGVPDRGRSLFEGILKEYPKRTDVWSIYLDQEIRLGDSDVIRALFERAISLSLPPKKMKFLFKKYLEYEKSVGDEERVESVKRKAIDYVESSLA